MKEKLLEMRKALLQTAQTTDEQAGVVELDQTRVGRLSRMDAMQAQAMAMETVRRRDLELRDVDAALKRVEDGEYGFCAACGEEIDPRRLEVDPTARHCIQCAARAEAQSE